LPGRGFGLSGEGFVRFSCFADEKLIEAGIDRLGKIG
jgi:aspartate/methionine/tyrosine aminotransferase